jgi:hypothetical protein
MMFSLCLYFLLVQPVLRRARQEPAQGLLASPCPHHDETTFAFTGETLAQCGRGPYRHLGCITAEDHDGDSGYLQSSQVVLQLGELLTTAPQKSPREKTRATG